MSQPSVSGSVDGDAPCLASDCYFAGLPHRRLTCSLADSVRVGIAAAWTDAAPPVATSIRPKYMRELPSWFVPKRLP